MVRKKEAGPIPFNVSDMGPDGRGKIRYIGGWAVRKALQKSLRYMYFSVLNALFRRVISKARLHETGKVLIETGMSYFRPVLMHVNIYYK